MNHKIVLAGPAHSGKSCLREGLKKALKLIKGAPYPYVITACPDGEGAWYQESVATHPDVAQSCKRAYKSSFSAAFVDRVEESVGKCSLPLALVDIGGRISDENKRICAGATDIIILSADPAAFAEWEQFAKELGLTVVSEIVSDYNGSQDVVQGISPADGILRGTIHHLERGEDLSDREMVNRLASRLAQMCQEN